MHYTQFYQYFPALAKAETRSITIPFNNEFGVPADDYGLMELYCEEPDCDCRRTMLMVVSRKSQKPLATITFGWENREFYERWFGIKDKNKMDDFDRKTIDELKGPALNTGSPQSKYASMILAMVSSLVLKNENYIERLKRHYKLFKDKVNSKKK